MYVHIRFTSLSELIVNVYCDLLSDQLFLQSLRRCFAEIKVCRLKLRMEEGIEFQSLMAEEKKSP